MQNEVKIYVLETVEEAHALRDTLNNRFKRQGSQDPLFSVHERHVMADSVWLHENGTYRNTQVAALCEGFECGWDAAVEQLDKMGRK